MLCLLSRRPGEREFAISSPPRLSLSAAITSPQAGCRVQGADVRPNWRASSGGEVCPPEPAELTGAGGTTGTSQL
jgi:hypothetical protein